jgi:hypothetical protein
MDLLRRRDWTCSCTGKTGLTFEEALLSEAHYAAHKAKVRVASGVLCAFRNTDSVAPLALRPQLPGWLQADVLRAVQHSTATLDALAEGAVDRLSASCVPGESCTAAVKGQVCRLTASMHAYITVACA